MASQTPLLADILSPRVRRITYALLSFTAGISAVVYAVLTDGFQAADVPVVITGVLLSGGFKMAHDNTQPDGS